MVTVAEQAILADFSGIVAGEAGFFADGLEVAGHLLGVAAHRVTGFARRQRNMPIVIENRERVR